MTEDLRTKLAERLMIIAEMLESGDEIGSLDVANNTFSIKATTGSLDITVSVKDNDAKALTFGEMFQEWPDTIGE